MKESDLKNWSDSGMMKKNEIGVVEDGDEGEREHGR